MPKIEFEGQVHEFPDDWSNDDISMALQSYGNGEQVVQPDHTTMSEEDRVVMSEQHTRPDAGGLGFESQLFNLNAKQEAFRANIQKIETGGMPSEWTRTNVKGSASTAYGTYQVTRGLLNGYLDTKRALFTEEEQGAMEELVRRQSIAIAVGGKDRAKYEAGGANHAQAKLWAKDFGYASVGDMLDDFDYGGSYGLEGDVEWQMHYENFSRKMLVDHLKQTGGDALEAASLWHGGTNWKKAKHKKDTEVYRRKYQTLTKGNG